MKIKNIFLVVAMAILGIVGSLSVAAVPVFADTLLAANDDSSSTANTGSDVIQADACKNLKEGTIAYESNGCGGSSKDELPTVIQNILNSVILLSGLVAVVFVVIGGVQYMTSTGDPGKTKKAKDTILYACLGLIICALAFIIVNWTISIIDSAK